MGDTDVLRDMVGRESTNREDFAGTRQQDAPQFLGALLNLMAGQLEPRSNVRLQTMMEPTLLCESSCPAEGNECGINRNFVQEKMLIVPVENCKTLHECVTKLLMEEEIQRQKACQGCGSTVVKRKGSIYSVPEVLIIQLKRMLHNPLDVDHPIKLAHRVTVPNEYQPITGGPLYILTGALLHQGMSGGSGHYVCITKDVRRDAYYLINDETVTQLSSMEAMDHINHSYLLIFCQKDCLEKQLVGTGGDHMLGITPLQVITKIMIAVL